jgi:hypothetical protein
LAASQLIAGVTSLIDIDYWIQSMRYQTECVKIRLKPNSLDAVREWAHTLNESRRAEALATLRDETVVFEAAFLDHTPEGDFLIYVTKAESFDKSEQAAARSTHDIDQYHRRFQKEAWGDRTPLELLVDLDRIDEVRDATARQSPSRGRAV